MKIIEGLQQGAGCRIAIVVSRWNTFVVESLEKGAVDTLMRHGVSENDMTIIRCPGAYEIPLTAKKAAQTQRFEGIITLGAVIRGDTPHFDYVAGECVKGISQVNMEQSIPVIFGVLTVDTLEQAIERSGTLSGNKGAEAAMAVLEMISLMKHLAV